MQVLQPGVGLAGLTGEQAADVAGRHAPGAQHRQAQVGHVLADAAAGRQHVRRRGVHRRAAAFVPDVGVNPAHHCFHRFQQRGCIAGGFLRRVPHAFGIHQLRCRQEFPRVQAVGQRGQRRIVGGRPRVLVQADLARRRDYQLVVRRGDADPVDHVAQAVGVGYLASGRHGGDFAAPGGGRLVSVVVGRQHEKVVVLHHDIRVPVSGDVGEMHRDRLCG